MLMFAYPLDKIKKTRVVYSINTSVILLFVYRLETNHIFKKNPHFIFLNTFYAKTVSRLPYFLARVHRLPLPPHFFSPFFKK